MTNTITLLDIIEDTVVDGPGFRVSVYAAGCTHHCPGCHNPQSWNLRNGHPVSLDYIVAKITNNPFSNVTFSGGDPLFQVEGFTQLAKRLKIIHPKISGATRVSATRKLLIPDDFPKFYLT